MKIKEIMTPSVEVVSPTDSLQTAASKMRKRDCGLLPVCDQDRLVGVVSDRDITIRAVAQGYDPKSAKVNDVKSDDVFWCYSDQDVDEATRLMEEKQVRRLVVLDPKDRRMVGIVALGDVAKNGTAKRSGEILQEVSQPPAQK